MKSIASRSLAPAPDSRRLSDAVYENVKEMIITLHLRPGQPLNEQGLMAHLGVGRTPLREAVLRLAAEGLVVIHPRRGTFVAGVNLDEVKQILELRLALEPLCARWAAERITERELEELRQVVEGKDAEDDRHTFQKDLRFHRVLNRASHNQFLATSLEYLQVLSIRLFHVTEATRQSKEEVQESHRRVLEAVRRHEPGEAAAAMREHALSAQSRLLSPGVVRRRRDGGNEKRNHEVKGGNGDE